MAIDPGAKTRQGAEFALCPPGPGGVKKKTASGPAAHQIGSSDKEICRSEKTSVAGASPGLQDDSAPPEKIIPFDDEEFEDF